MTILVIIGLSVVLTLSLFTRFYLLLKYKWVGKDTFYHFLVARIIKNKGFPPDYIDMFVKPEKYDYPPAFHLFLSLFSERKYQKLQYLSPIIDLFTSAIIFLFCSTLFNFQVAIMSTLLYSITPFVLDNAYSFNPRSFANFFFVLALFSCISVLLLDSGIWLIASILFSTLVLLLHRLTTQCLIVVLTALSLGSHSFLPIVILLLSILTAIVMTRGFYLKVLKGHLGFITEFGNKVFNSKFRDERPALFPDLKQLLFNMPILLSLLLLICYPLDLQGAFIYPIVIWALALTVLSFIWVFGEGIRHMICSAPAFSILAALVVTTHHLNLVYFILVVVSVLFSLYKIYRLEKYPQNSGIIKKDMLNAFDYIRMNKTEGDILFCLPLDYCYNAAYFTDCIMLQSSGGFAKGLSFNQSLHKMVNMGLIDEIINDYHPDWIIILEKPTRFLSKSSILNQKINTFDFGESTVIHLTW